MRENQKLGEVNKDADQRVAEELDEEIRQAEINRPNEAGAEDGELSVKEGKRNTWNEAVINNLDNEAADTYKQEVDV